MSTTATNRVLPWLISLLKPYKARVGAALVALVVGSGASLALGQGVKMVVDEGFVANNAARLDQVLMFVVAIALIGSVAVYFRFYLMTWLGERVSGDIRNKVYHHLLSLSPTFFAQTRTGEVISRFTADTTVLQTVVGMSLSMAIRSGLTFIGALLLMLITSPRMTLFVLVAVPLVLLPIKLLGAKVRHFSKVSQDKVADVGAFVDETLHEIHTVQAYTHEDIDRGAFSQRVEDVVETAEHRIKYRGLLIASVMTISITAIATVAWLGARSVLTGDISAGELAAFIFYAVLAAGAVATISEVIGEIQKAAGASDRLRELLATKADILAPANPLPLPHELQGAIQLRDISFAYPGALEHPVIKHLNLAIAPGERIALVGPSGAGKSTLFQLLQAFYRPQRGQVLLDDVDAESLDPQTLRQQFALVPQDPVVFATSATENIRYGRPNANHAEVVAAAKAARADEFISALPQGYDTDLGERGVKLSGGQKQRIAIARAILADRPILLLDEATSALDAGNEQLVKQALDELMKGKTSIVIAHRLATVVNADRIVVMDQGQISAIGTHQELLEQSNLYRDYAELQLVS